MDTIFNLLKRYRLESYFKQFCQLGVKDERDFLDSVTDEDLNSLGKVYFVVFNSSCCLLRKWRQPYKLEHRVPVKCGSIQLKAQLWAALHVLVNAKTCWLFSIFFIVTGLSRVEKNRFSAMKNFLQRGRTPEHQVQTVLPVQKSVQSFHLQYTYPRCPQPKYIKGKRFCHFFIHSDCSYFTLKVCIIVNLQMWIQYKTQLKIWC